MLKHLALATLLLTPIWLCAAETKPIKAEDIPAPPPLTAAAKALLDDVNQRITNINTEELQQILTDNPQTYVVDVRTPEEVLLTGGMIDTPRRYIIPRGWIDIQADTRFPDKNTPIVVYCGVNQRSPLAADTLMKLGYTNVKNYADGFNTWKASGLPVDTRDAAPESFLYSKPVEVIPGVWSAIGATAPGTYDNSGHNNNLSFIITDDGVLVMNAGDNYLLAQSLHDEIKQRTDQPVKYVILENAQGHAMLGSNYWKEQGATIIAHDIAAQKIEKQGKAILKRMQRRNRDKAYRTEVVTPDKTFSDSLDVSLGNWKMRAMDIGPAHSPGDILLWLPEKKLVITGDVAFHERMLPVFEETDTAAWIETWDALEALAPQYVIPGHGGPTDMKQVTQYTKGYLQHMRTEIQTVIDDGGSLTDAYKVDQSPFNHLDTFDELAARNAARIFQAMEFE